MLVLFAVQFILPAIFGQEVRHWITLAFLGWAVFGFVIFAVKRPKKNALQFPRNVEGARIGRALSVA